MRQNKELLVLNLVVSKWTDSLPDLLDLELVLQSMLLDGILKLGNEGILLLFGHLPEVRHFLF